MNRKLIGILIITSGLIMLVGIVYVIFFHDFSPEEPERQEEVPEISITPPIQEEFIQEEIPTQPAKQEITTPKEKPITQRAVSQKDLERIAASFAERFGSYSNQSNFRNLTDLKIYMSARMKSWVDNYVKTARAKGSTTDIYYGITTKAMTQEVKSFDDDLGEAEILVKTQRREAIGTTANASTFYQDILVNFIKEKGMWKVDNAYWQDK